MRVPEGTKSSKSVRALLRKYLKNQAAMISIPIARPIRPVDSIDLTRLSSLNSTLDCGLAGFGRVLDGRGVQLDGPLASLESPG